MARFDSTCWTVVLGAADGDPTNRDAFCRQYGPVIRAYLAARWRIPLASERVGEGAQEVFLQFFDSDSAFNRLDRTRSGGFRAFLYGVTSRTAAGMERRLARQRRDGSVQGIDLDRVEKSEANLSVVFDRAWAKMLGQEARQLMVSRTEGSAAASNRLRCMELRFVRGMPPREIAPAMKVPVERVYEMLHTARREYRAALLAVMASYRPGLSEKELEEACAELVSLS